VSASPQSPGAGAATPVRLRDPDAPELERYRAIERFAEAELELAGLGELDALESHLLGWQALTDGLPATPPAAAAPILVRAELLRERAHVELLRERGRLSAEVAAARELARAVAGYAPVTARPAQLDRSA
jgi:hypothetical protein